MDLPPVREQLTSTHLPELSASSFLLERGFNYIEEGAYAEAAAILALALDQLPDSQAQLASVLRAFLHRYQSYRSVQQALQKASLCFALAQDELQDYVTVFKTSLAALMQTMNNADAPLVGAQDHIDKLIAGAIHLQAKPPLQLSAQMAAAAKSDTSLPALFVTCFGRFTVRRLNELVALCSSRGGQSILRYLVAQSGHYASRDALQVMLWPEDTEEAAQRKLHIAISALRRSLHNGPLADPGAGYILYKNSVYSLNPLAVIHSDVDEFVHYYQLGQQKSEQRIALYEQACRLYTGPFLPEDMYADWSFLQRAELSQAYLTMCHTLARHYLEIKRFQEAAQWSTAILKEDRCDEAAHRQLITIYAAQGRRSEALQQFQRCKLILHEELGVQPLPETRQALQAGLANNV